MNAHANHSFPWSVPSVSLSAVGGSANRRPADVDSLAAHVRRCNGDRGAWFSLRCLMDVAHGFIAPRFVTTIGIAAIGFALISVVI